MPEVDKWKDIEIPRRLEAQWHDIQDYLTDEDDIQRAILKALIFQTRMMQGRAEEAPVSPKPLRQLKQLSGLPIKPNNFEQVETEGKVTVEPGERQEIVKWDPFPSGILWELGVTDQSYTDYKYIVDGEPIFEEAQREPLGTFNDPYRFPNPILVDDSVIVEVVRDSDATSDVDYVGKVRGIDEVPQALQNQLSRIWEV